MVMNEGRIIEQDTTEEIFSNPKTDYAKSLIEASFLKAIGSLPQADCQLLYPAPGRAQRGPGKRIPRETSNYIILTAGAGPLPWRLKPGYSASACSEEERSQL